MQVRHAVLNATHVPPHGCHARVALNIVHAKCDDMKIVKKELLFCVSSPTVHHTGIRKSACRLLSIPSTGNANTDKCAWLTHLQSFRKLLVLQIITNMFVIIVMTIVLVIFGSLW